MAITEEQIAKHKTANPGVELHVISNAASGMEILVKAPSDGEYNRFRTLYADPAHRHTAVKTLVLGCILEPPPAEFTAMLATRPALAESFSDDLLEMAGLNRANVRRKV